LFVPQPSVADIRQLEYYAEALDELAEHYDVEIGYPQFGDDDGWRQKLEVVADLRPELVSFTFGAPSPDVLRWFGARGMLLFVTVTSAYEAGVALAAGADGLVVQGPDAGGHRGTFAPDMSPGTEPLTELLRRIGRAHDVPLIAAGGLGSTEDVAVVLRRGAVAAQIGTALLLSDEAGTNAAHRSALGHPQFDATVVTRAFSGRYARGLANDFTRMLDQIAPLGYPEVNQMTSPIRRAAVELEDPHGTNLWAGTAYRQAQAGPAKDIVSKLGHV
jgi:nitronate monooxygenase